MGLRIIRESIPFEAGKVLLGNPLKPEIQAIETNAFATTGSVYLIIPEDIANRLQLQLLGKREVAAPNTGLMDVDYVGPIELRYKDRVGFMGALVMGDQILLGVIPMEDMDLVVIPRTR